MLAVSYLCIPADLQTTDQRCLNMCCSVRASPPAALELISLRWRPMPARSVSDPPDQPAVLFEGIDSCGAACGTTTDVHVLRNGQRLFNNEVTGFRNQQAFDLTSEELAMRHTIEFAVGYGTNGNYYDDSTGLRAPLPWYLRRIRYRLCLSPPRY